MRGRTWTAAVAGALLTASLAGCTASDEPGDVAREVTAELRVGLTEWSIETGPVAAAAGEVEVVVTNTGGTRHDLAVHGQHGTWRTPMLDPGQQHELTIRTTAGEVLRLDCTVAGHHDQGMYAELPVGRP